MDNLLFKKFSELISFNTLSDQLLNKIFNITKLVKFSLGEEIIQESTISGKIFIIKEGNARLIATIDSKITTLGKFGSGEILGAASLLSGRSCENFIAAEPLIAYSIDEEDWLKLYSSNYEFKRFCDTKLYPQEVIYLVKTLVERSARNSNKLKEYIQSALSKSSIIDHTIQNISEVISSGYQVFYCSSWSSKYKDCETINQYNVKSNSSAILDRLIALPNSLIDQINKSSVNNDSNTNEYLNENLINSINSKTSKSKFNKSENYEQKIDYLIADNSKDQAITCYQMLSRLMNIPFRRDSIERILDDINKKNQIPTLLNYGQIAAGLGLHIVRAKVSPESASRLLTPSLFLWKGILTLIIDSNEDGLILASPRDGKLKISMSELSSNYENEIEYLILEKVRTTPVDRFGPSWFIPVIRRYRNVLLQVVIASFVVQLFTLANPLIIQVIIDKVISQRSLDTLQVLGIALLVLTLVEGVLASLKTFLFVETTNRIDQKLGSEVIDHLLRLPLEYFDKRPVGELGTRIGELEKIRNFITGRGLTTILDAGYSIIYIGVMVLYSIQLTLIALVVLPIQVGLTIIGAPLFRKQFRESAEDNAKTQSHLIEVITGIQTVKAQNIETSSRWKWQELYSKYITTSFKKTITGTALNQTSQVLQKLSQLMVLWFGASMVLKGTLTLGQLIAFRIISGYVTQPILRLTTIWQNVQELRVSFERLGDVINTNTESDETDKGKIALPPVVGKVKFDNINFNFQYSTKPILNNIDIEIPTKTFVGIVGKSGSGKSTLMKLLSRLYSPNKGKITIDGFDIDKVELYSLRRQIGIVPQDPLLFSGTISDNISGQIDTATEEEIIKAAKLAEAHEFIMQMHSGYNTNIGERGTSLSGGQKQRIAIARTLFTSPKILVFDEATSALDFETEKNVVKNLKSKFNESTIFFITHRLSTVSTADLIIMMENGSISEMDNYKNLMLKKGSFYNLYNQQESL